ncbi:MAG: hypothetical protein J0M11_11510 [Anaerolineae bacterium]|nr:hypothetical protein [Anaerolineae bacterium]
MKNENFKKIFFFASLIILVILSIVVTVFVYIQYRSVARGILGIAVIYLMPRLERQIKFRNSLEEIALDPKKEKYLIAAFVWPLVYAWSIAQVGEMIFSFF